MRLGLCTLFCLEYQTKVCSLLSTRQPQPPLFPSLWLTVVRQRPFRCSIQHDLSAGVLPELDALGALLEANEEWQQDAAGVRSRMLAILGSVADRYEATGLPSV